MNPNALST